MRDEVANILLKELKGKLKREEILDLIEVPPQDDMGDYAFPCFSLAKIEKKSPLLIAENLKEKLKLTDEFSNTSAVAGYVNFFIDKRLLARRVLENVGKIKKTKKKKEKIILEHTSVNPNASPHVGRARNALIGDSIKRILEFNGHKVETHYYVNDVSKQIAMLALVFKRKDKFESLLKKYVDISGKVKNSEKRERKVFDMLKKFEEGDKKTVALFKKIVDVAIKGQKKILSSMGIEFDYFDYESSFLKEQDNVIKELHKKGEVCIDNYNRHILRQESLRGMMKEPVLVLTRSDNTGLYPLRDIAYTLWKIKKGRNIIVLGEGQKLYFKQIEEALKLLNKKAPEVVHYSFVLLKGKGKMSTRKGDLVLLDSFLEELRKKAGVEIKKRGTKGDPMIVAISAFKYHMLRTDNNRAITFDVDEALRFEGDTGPYLLYSYARASSIIRKTKSRKNQKFKIIDIKDQEIRLLKKISHFEDVVNKAYDNFAPNLIANYTYELAKLFNEFYHECNVLGSDEEVFRLKLVDAFRITLKKTLSLLGIDVLEEM